MQLTKAGYDIFLPLQRPICDELVISDGNRLRRFLIKNVANTNQGPVLSITTHKQILNNSTSIDGIIASRPLNNDVWLVPIEAIVGVQVVRLMNRDDWLIKPVKRLDAPTRIDIHPDVAKSIKEHREIEEGTVKEAEKERGFFNRILSEGE